MGTRSRTVTVVLLAAVTTLAFAKETGKPALKISSFAPAKELDGQLKVFLGKLTADLSDKEDFGEAHEKRVRLNASTVAVLALMLGHHDEKTEHKKSASALIELAGELADSSDDFEAAGAAHGKLKKAFAEHPKGEAVSWEEPVAELAALMQQVPIVNDSLRRGVNDKRRFKRNAAKAAGTAITLASIAQASMMDTTYCGDEDDEKEWKKICAEMRDACTEVYKALMAKDQDKAKAGNARVVKTCDACHDKFR